MPVIAIIGAQWGDEGKGKIIDLLAENAKIVVRFSGGNNAGHTVINNLGEFKLHLIPAGIFDSKAICIMGPGVVVDPAAFLEERNQLEESGIDTSRLYISDRAHLVMPYHLLLDELEEKIRGRKAIGTTLRGVGPAYTDKVTRLGIRVGELLNKEEFKRRLEFVLENKNRLLKGVYGVEPMSLDEVYEKYCEYAEELKRHIRETTVILEEAIEKNEIVIFEGAQGAMLDLDYGTYPYTTSSSPLAAGASLGGGVGPTKFDRVVGVYKAYTTRVGSGPMPTELKDEMGDRIRNIAKEFGTTTGRPRRCGWFDSVAARFSRRINGFTGAVITRLDIFDTFPKIKVCTGYELDGKVIHNFPSDVATLERCKPIFEEHDGWETCTEQICEYEDLPENAKKYIARLEELIGCPVNLACVGPRREQAIYKSEIF